MTIDELITFRDFVDRFIKMISYHENNFRSSKKGQESSRVLDFMMPKFRDIVLFYIKKFCNERSISSNNVFLTSLRVDILQRVREHTPVTLPKMYAKILKTTKN